ncbi:uncharacterized protein LOC143367133 [Andrena cerasifolii]|uniref:uncharacterized protein LOC143367133 n=1 Tax=Andrena cerasifolii TaxID=2819439 RepID=UPI0040380BAE
MATAIINVLNLDQQPIECRTLIDTCANANFMTEDFAAKLRLQKRKLPVAIEALNAISTVTNQVVATTIESRSSKFKRNLTFFTIPRISGLLPDTQIDRAKLQIPANIRLADPHFHRPAPVNMLIGSGPSLASLSVGQINLSPHNASDLILQKTQFGWIIGGSAPSTAPHAKRNTFLTKLDFDLKSFWEVEEGPHGRHLSSEERICEEHFSNHVQRDASGRYIVALPFNKKLSLLGESYSQAVNRFSSLERKLNRDPELRREYSAVIKEYLSLGHMSQVRTHNSHGFYLPHHAVIKPSSTTTKVRVVFDGSAKSSSGLSLNDTLITGPTIQDDIFSLLLRFRLYMYVLTGDIEKMYRQFLVRPEDRKYQRILWRNEQNEIATYELNTVTFGLSSAPFQAIRCLHQLADDEEANYPKATTTLKRDMYVDDLLTGANTFREAQVLRDEIINILQRGGLNIRQWTSNEPKLLTGLTKEQIHPKVFEDSTTVKTLGIFWNAREDNISYTVNSNITERITKRTILSSIARIFDPLGLLGPVTITAKIIMQQLWQLQLDWDESLPIKLHTEWNTFITDLMHLNNLSFKRNVTQRMPRSLELHGFCDASERAYGACVYVRSINETGQIKTDLLCAKSRVAPLKTITLARLELCAATLLATLFKNVQRATAKEIKTTTFWTDSTIVLNWLHKEPSTLKTFVANRVADIQIKTNNKAWRHIRSHDNPADLLSRGQPPAQFIQNSNWSHGPKWLSNKESAWPVSRFNFLKEIPEMRRISCFATIVKNNELLNRYSSLPRLTKIVAYCLRFRFPNQSKGPPTVEELQAANDRIIQLVQSSAFAQDIHQLNTRVQLHHKSKLLPLHPFVDDKGLLRVGGRLQNSTLSYEKKHPILLPKGHHITDLIIRQAHVDNHQAGITTTLYAVRQTYWLIDGRNATRKIVRQCVKCFRIKPPATDYIMGHLPAARKDGKVQQFLTEKRISWHFMPALSPHFGGLWEAAVKSFKHHVKRVVGGELFTFEQFNTFVIEIEAILNSRPLTPLSSDPNDPLALTPARHQAIGYVNGNIQKVKQDFWSRWHKEYINQLNVRQKWTKGAHNITEGTIVVLKEDHLPPLQWRLGRVEMVHPGNDKVIRAVTVRTATGSYKRNVRQMAPLPIQPDS